MINKYLIFVFLFSFLLGIISCKRKEKTEIDPSVKINAQIYQHNYFDALDLIDEYQNSLSEQQILWSKLLVYWDLLQIYDLGYHCALKLQQENYNWYLKNTADANQEILIPALCFLANNYYFDGALGQAQITIQKGLKYISNDHPFYDRFLIFINPERGLSVNHPDYYYQQYLNNKTPDVTVIRNQIDKLKITSKDIDYLRYIDVLTLAIQLGLYQEILPIIREEAYFPGTYSQTLSIDNLKVNHIDLRVLLIRRDLFKNLYITTLEVLMKNQGSPDFDSYAFERAAWAELLKGDYEESEHHFKKWLEFINLTYSGKFLDYQQTHYQALIQLCSDLQKNQYSNRYAIKEIDIRDPIEANGSLTYNYFYNYFKEDPRSKKFFDEIKQRISCFYYPIQKGDPESERIYIDNMSLLIKYFINDDESQSAKLILIINDFTRGYDIKSLEKLSYANIKAVEIFALLPYALKDEKYPLDLVSSAYAAAKNFPISSIMIDLIAFKKAIEETGISGDHSLE